MHGPVWSTLNNGPLISPTHKDVCRLIDQMKEGQ